ncbi:MAG: 3-dehydroquinate synthase II family protein [Deltaproteobacteria bacterium]|nr:3-dehydroquinate synthase II family protein [Deltaproteobacteria bacterium]
MQRTIIFSAVPFDKNLVTLALESGVDGILVEDERAGDVSALGLTTVHRLSETVLIDLKSKEDEERAVSSLSGGALTILGKGWEIIPVENILAQAQGLGLEVESLDRAILAAGILEVGVETIIVLPQAAHELKDIVAQFKTRQGQVDLETAVVTEVRPTGLGHRVCVDTLSILRPGQGMLVGNTSAFCFLVHAETEANPYVAPRPFRINAGSVHAYAALPGDKTAYLEELGPGREVLIVGADGQSHKGVVGRAKTEIRPMLMITAQVGERHGCIFLQNAETIRLVRPGGDSVSVVSLKPGDEILCRLDQAGRHFGMRIKEEIHE